MIPILNTGNNVQIEIIYGMRNFARPGALSYNDWRVWLAGKLKRKGGISRKKCGKNNGNKQVNGKCLCH